MGVSVEQQAAADRLVTASKNELTESNRIWNRCW